MSDEKTNEPAPETGTKVELDQQFRFRTGTVMGHEHKRLGLSKQDALVLGGVNTENKKYVVGVVNDGCTSKEFGRRSHNEVGANLMSEFISSEIGVLLSNGVGIEEVPAMLFPRCIGYIRNLVGITKSGPPDVIWNLVSRMFLCTTMGFIKDEERLVVFHDADGIYIVNDEVTVIDQKNIPTYLALHMLDEHTVKKHNVIRPQGFTVRTFEVAKLKRFAIATDGITSRDGVGGQLIVAPEDVEALWSHAPQAPAGLQWWLNIQSNQKHRFSDDATVIAAERR